MTIKEVEIIVEMYKQEVKEFQLMFDTGIAWKINIDKNVNDFRKKIVEKLSKKIDQYGKFRKKSIKKSIKKSYV